MDCLNTVKTKDVKINYKNKYNKLLNFFRVTDNFELFIAFIIFLCIINIIIITLS
jgi:hypothetical protein